MRTIFSITSFLILQSLLGYGQGPIRHSVYFDTDEHALRTDQAQSLLSWLDSLPTYNIAAVEISGHTDSDADSVYNILLSDNRCKTVQHQLLERGFSPELLQVTYHGENRPVAANTDAPGKQQNRRVDITVRYNEIPRPDDIERVITDSCEGKDTTLIFEDGTRMIFNACEYAELKECLEIKLWNDIKDAQQDGVSMLDDNGNQLVSNGMFSIAVKSQCQDIACFKNKVQVLVPLAADNCDYCGNNQQLYNMNSDGQWVKDESGNIEIVEINGLKYLKVWLECPGKVNFDCELLDAVKLKFKAPRDYTISSLQLVNECPRAIITFTDQRKSNATVSNVPCWENWLVYATLLTPQGDTLVIKGDALEKTGDPKTVCSKCAKDRSNKSKQGTSIFRTAKRAHYRKYKLTKKYLQGF